MNSRIALVVSLALFTLGGGKLEAQSVEGSSPLRFRPLETIDALPWLPAPEVDRGLSGQRSPTLPVGIPPRSIGRKVLFGVIGAVGGMLLGGAIGAHIEGNRCACDDPGLVGWTIGAPIGGIAGGYLGVRLAGR